MKTMTKKFQVSPSGLNLFKDCPRCFWLEKVRSIKRPRGIFPSLPSGMDRVIKAYFDTFRAKNILPPELQEHPEFKGVSLYEDLVQLERWRNWRTGLEHFEDGTRLFGALDDLLVKDGLYIPFDYKTKGAPTSEADAVKYYQTQLDCYALMLEGYGFKPAGHGFLLYYSPKTVGEHGNVAFEIQPIKIMTETERAKELVRKATAIVSGPAPKAFANCEYCNWLEKFRK